MQLHIMNRLPKILSTITGIFLLAMISSAHVPESGCLYEPVIIELEEENWMETLDNLKNSGVVVYHNRGPLVLASIPVEETRADHISSENPGITSISRDEMKKAGIVKIETGRRAMPALDVARTMFGAERVLNGESLPKAYTGQGVVTGFCDIGFDPLHLNFRNDSGQTRVKRIIDYREYYGLRTVMESEEEYKAWITDDPEYTHATHVAGIMSGSYKPNNYYGIASGADIIATTSMLTDVGLLAGAEDILEYAREVNRPAVINMSMGTYTGPHDGTSLFCRYLDILGEEAIICLSAGNEGDEPMTFSPIFSADRPKASIVINDISGKQFLMQGSIETWSINNRPFKARMLCLDSNSGEVVFSLPTVEVMEEVDCYYDASEIHEMGECFQGRIKLSGGLSPSNNRRFLLLTMNTRTSVETADGVARYIWAIEFEGEPGVQVISNADMEYTKFGASDTDAANSRMSISDLATGYNTLSVGMYVCRNKAPLITGEFRTFPAEENEIDKNSSYGTLPDGRIMPETVGPGTMLISSASGPFYIRYPEYIPMSSYRETVGDTDYYWNINSGTSMSCPYVAGFIATWLEANPTLTIKDIKEIISATNDTEHSYSDNPRNGGGWFRPYEGIVKALEYVSSTEISGNLDIKELPRLEWSGDVLRVYSPQKCGGVLTIYSLSGNRILTQDIPENAVSELTLSLNTGMYMAVLSGIYGDVKIKFLIK